MKILLGLILFIGVIILFIFINPIFGLKISKGKKSEYSSRSKNYVKGKFIYPSEYEMDGEKSDVRVSKKGKSPEEKLPLMKPNISNLAKNDEVKVTWFGHSSLFIQMQGLNIFIDPVFSKRPSPISFVGPKRFTEAPMTIEELPAIDIVIITHNHYDHLDMKAIKKIDDKVEKYIVPLGVEKHLERWNINNSKIQSMTWWEEVDTEGLIVACTPSRHFANRQVFDSNSTLYTSWVLKNENHKIFASGDGGFGGHFDEIHKRYGDFDLAFMECGQYNMSWHSIHMFPEESVKAAKMLGARVSMPIHFGTFVLSNHGWDDSVERFVKASEDSNAQVITPKIGETVYLDKYKDYQEKWWRDIK